MAKNDELDTVLSDQRVTKEEWDALGEILQIKDLWEMRADKRCEAVNKEIRHSYGHTVANIFRNPYEPDYVSPVLVETAKKLKITINNYRVEDIEDKIIIKVIEEMWEKIVKDKGQAEWDKLEKGIQDNLDELIKLGKLPNNVADELRRLRGAALMAALLGGKLAGFALFIVANQTFFAITRFLGLRIGVAVAGPVIGGGLAFLLGPAGIGLAGLTLLYDLGNSNWKKVIPAVVMVAAIRKRLAFDSDLVAIN